MTRKIDTRLKVADIPPFALRLRPEVRRRLEIEARDNNRSLNAEIVARLEASFAQEDAAEFFGTGRVERIEQGLERAKKSPMIRMEKQLIGVEARLDGRIDDLVQRVAALETKAKP